MPLKFLAVYKPHFFSA